MYGILDEANSFRDLLNLGDCIHEIKLIFMKYLAGSLALHGTFH